MTQPAPHAGEMHPDGDELLFLVSGRSGTGSSSRKPGQLVHITPGPGGQHRPLRREGADRRRGVVACAGKGGPVPRVRCSERAQRRKAGSEEARRWRGR